MPLHIQYSYTQIESLNKKTYANNANMTAICQNSTVYKECKSINTYLTPKIMKIYHTVENLSELIFQKVSTCYHILTFLENSRNSVQLSVFKQQHADLQNKHSKGYYCQFY